jgi:hypothetical protein
MAIMALFADWDAIWPKLAGYGVLVLLVVVPFGAIFIKRVGQRRVAAIVSDILSRDRTTTGPKVEIVFHTYHGFPAYFVQSRIRQRLSPGAAERLLKRLHRFNWGLFCPGVLYIPFLSRSEYKAQLRSISRQL